LCTIPRMKFSTWHWAQGSSRSSPISYHSDPCSHDPFTWVTCPSAKLNSMLFPNLSLGSCPYLCLQCSLPFANGQSLILSPSFSEHPVLILHQQCRRPRRQGFDPWVGKIPWQEEVATHSRILAWKIPRTEDPGRLQSKESQRFGHDWETKHRHTQSYGILHISV